MHQQSTEKTKERAVAGKTSGLIEKGNFVTWEAIHFGIKQRLTVSIVEMNYPYYFNDKMVKGAFKEMNHSHFFEFEQGKTLMRDEFTYQTPFGILGAIFDKLILRTYMEKFLIERNRILKNVAESNESNLII
ncbi:SRPBCC family protein [Spirosoma endbachense]|uniref:SRPBCC family protein n=1 Tax=Spirosoma endbachense TaxID=2666025 RepID=UPI001E48653F|nr:SRPBCC family protein [Spirosoma endbachense]